MHTTSAAKYAICGNYRFEVRSNCIVIDSLLLIENVARGGCFQLGLALFFD